MKVYSERLSDGIGDRRISLSEQAKGIYILKVRTQGNLVHTEKLIYQ
jgi:hypothetical protein